MKIKGIYARRPGIFQLLVLLIFLLAGAMLSSAVTLGIQSLTCGIHGDITQYPGLMRLVQFISALGTFLIPSLLTAWTCSERPEEFLSMRKVADGRIWLLVFTSMFLLSPTISLLGLANKHMSLPVFMAPIEEWMRAQEDLMERLTKILVGDDSIWTILSNLVVIAIAAGVTEEFLFRGTLQRILEKWTNNHHIVIWIAAILFSAVHLQFYGFLPRMILGAYFGYLLFWSRSIWIPVFAHFVNNAFAVIGMSDSRLKNNEYITGDIPQEDLLQFSLAAAFTFILFIRITRQIIKRSKEA